MKAKFGNQHVHVRALLKESHFQISEQTMKVNWRVELLALTLTQLARLQLKSADNSCHMS